MTKKIIHRFVAVMMLAGFPRVADACMTFSQPDPVFWSEHATTIVDATVRDYSQQPLINPEAQEPTIEDYVTWVLELDIHRTLRGGPSDVRFIATRFWNTTIVDERYLEDLLGERREFALVGFRGTPSTAFTGTSDNSRFPYDDDLLPAHNGYHVFDKMGDPIDEIWEGLCTALPMFDLGTFED